MYAFEVRPLVFTAVLVSMVRSSASSTLTVVMSEGDDHGEKYGNVDEKASGGNTNETECRLFLEEYNQLAMEVYSDFMEKQWAYNTNITEFNQQLVVISL